SLALLFATAPVAVPQDTEPRIHVTVDMVQLNVAVTDNKGNYVTNLRPQDFVITEDGIQQKIATFAEGKEATRRLEEISTDTKSSAENHGAEGETVGDKTRDLSAMVAGANVFILFDTSNYMYRGFVFAQDAISDFVRSLDGADRIAFYSYS